MRLKKVAAAAVAMVMAVSMLSVPVFAEDSDTTTTTESNVGEEVASGTNDVKGTDNHTASTEVKLVYSSSSSQISVTVPISVTFAVQSNGNFICPSEDAYKIINHSVVPVHVEKISVTMKNAGDKLVETASSAGDIQLKMTAKKDDKTNAVQLKSNTTTSTTSEDQTFGTENQDVWNIAANTENTTTGTSLPIHFEGKAKSVKTEWATGTTELLTITYTIKAGNAKTTDSSASSNE